MLPLLLLLGRDQRHREMRAIKASGVHNGPTSFYREIDPFTLQQKW